MELFLKLVVLGVIQGLTEFLPVSSKGHLVLGKHLLGVDVAGDRGATVEIALHAGTFFAVLLYMRRDIFRLLRALAPSRETGARPLLAGVIVATLPTAIIGLLFKNSIEKWFDMPRITGVGFLFTALILWFSRKRQDGAGEADTISWRTALVVGLAQVLALVPGVSRSATTIVAGVTCGLSPRESARFSFLMSMPVIFGALVLDANDLRAVPREQLAGIGAGIVASFVTGLLALEVLSFIARRGRVPWFAAYLVPLGIATLLWF